MTETPKDLHSRELVILATILLAATVLRVWRLDSVPPGLTHDEAGHGRDAIAILNGARPLYQTVGYGREPLYDYWVAGLMAVIGRTREVLRFSAVPLSLLTLLATFAWTRLAYDNAVALAGTALQGVTFWSLSVARQALRSSLLPALFTAAIFFFWRSVSQAEDSPRRGPLSLFALLIGASLYTYVPARGLWVIFPLFLVYLALFHRTAFRSLSGPAFTAVGVGLLLAMPLFVYLRSHPGAEQRLMMLDAPVRALMEGDPSVILKNACQFVSSFFIRGQGDEFLAYNIPGRPVFGPVTGILFLIGLGICVTRWREPAAAFSLIWFIVGISPSLITGPAASTTRSVGALPVTFLFPALSVVSGARWAGRRWGDAGPWLVGLASAGLLLAVGVSSICDYFVTWGESPHTRAAYQHTLVETAEYLDNQAAGGVVAMSSLEPYSPHDPSVFEMSLRRRDVAVRWFDAQRALVVPTELRARLIVPSSCPVSKEFAELPGLRLTERIEMRPDDLDPWFEVYDWHPRSTLDALMSTVEHSELSSSLEAALSKSGRAEPDLQLPVTFGEALDLLGYDLRPVSVAPGEEIELLTLWRATHPGLLQAEDSADLDSEPVIFVHALDTAGQLVAQEDRLDAPAWAWHEGDVVAQVHRLTLPSTLPDKAVVLAVGIYRRVDMTRLPVSSGDLGVGDSVFLAPVDVKG